MADVRTLPDDAIITGWDFSTGACKCLAFDLRGNVVAEVRLPTDLWTDGGVSEFSLLQLEGQARSSTRRIADELRAKGRIATWIAGGISATHHTAGRVDLRMNPIRRMICWNDQTLAEYHARGLARLGGPAKVQELLGGPWAVRYSLSHLVKDETTLPESDWHRPWRMVPHGTAAGGYLTGRSDVISISSAASTGMMDFRSNQWARGMLEAIARPEYRDSAWKALPAIQQEMNEPIGPLSESTKLDARIDPSISPLIFPTLDDQAAGLVGGGATEPGQVAIILGNSAVVNSSADAAPTTDNLDAMKLNWGPYLWMRCYSNGAQFLDRVVGSKPDWPMLEAAGLAVPPGCGGVAVLPFALSEPSLGVHSPRFEWLPTEPHDPGVRFRASLEALAYLIALGVEAHEAAGQKITRITVSGGIARSPLMGSILASVLGRRIETLRSSEGTALGAAVVALAGIESYRRKQQGIAEPYGVADAVKQLVQFGPAIEPVAEWTAAYRKELAAFRDRIRG
jgi:xylulokinase